MKWGCGELAKSRQSPPTSTAPESDRARKPQTQTLGSAAPEPAAPHGAFAPTRNTTVAKAPTKNEVAFCRSAHEPVHRKTSHELGTARELQGVGLGISRVEGRDPRKIEKKKSCRRRGRWKRMWDAPSHFAQFRAIAPAGSSLYAGSRPLSRLRVLACLLNEIARLYCSRHSVAVVAELQQAYGQRTPTHDVFNGSCRLVGGADTRSVNETFQCVLSRLNDGEMCADTVATLRRGAGLAAFPVWLALSSS
jgi:hypothetical protein